MRVMFNLYLAIVLISITFLPLWITVIYSSESTRKRVIIVSLLFYGVLIINGLVGSVAGNSNDLSQVTTLLFNGLCNGIIKLESVFEFIFQSHFDGLVNVRALFFSGIFSTTLCEGAEDLPYIMEFSNLHLSDSLKQIKITLTDYSGIYCVKCEETGAMYIGSAMDLAGRLVEHIIGNRSNIHLQNAIAKYGLSLFTLYVLEFCPIESLLKREQYYLDWLFKLPANLRYNFCPTAGSRLGSQASEETKALISAKTKGINNPAFGRTGALNPMFGKIPKNAQSVSVFNANGELIKTFPSYAATGKWLGVDATTVTRWVKSGRLYSNQYYLKSSSS